MQRQRVMRRRLWFTLALGAGVLACRQEEAPGAPPTIAVSETLHDVCAAQVAVDTSALGLSVPARSASFCIDPNGELRSYGASSMRELDEGCELLFAGACDAYRRHGLRQIWTWRYVEDSGRPKSVVVRALRFGGLSSAYAMFTQDVVRERAGALAVRPLEARGEAILAGTLAVLWRGPYVVELRYQDEEQPPEGARRAAAAVLAQLVRDVSQRLDGGADPPEAVRRLPSAERVMLGIKFTLRDMLGVAGLGSAAVAEYRREERSYRVLIAVRGDAERMDDVLHALRRLPGYRKLKRMPYRAFQLHRAASPDEPRVEWLVGATAERLAAVGNVRVAGAAGAGSEPALTERDKLELLRHVLSAP